MNGPLPPVRRADDKGHTWPDVIVAGFRHPLTALSFIFAFSAFVFAASCKLHIPIPFLDSYLQTPAQAAEETKP